jgi:predicted N-acetyltransferase YhbS
MSPSNWDGMPKSFISGVGAKLPSSWEIEIFQTSHVPPATQEIINRLDHLAFAGETDEGINEWADSDWMVLGRVTGEIVAQLGLLKRDILVGGARLTVGGVGGVATLPAWQRRGLGSALMRAAAQFLQSKLIVPFGLLVCADETQPFYARLGWEKVATELWVTQVKKSRPLQTAVMILPLADQEWPQGRIDLCGLPW